MATIPRTRLAHTAVQLLEKYSVKQVAQALANMLVQQRKVRETDWLLQDISAELLRNKQHVTATLTSAHPLSKKTTKAITDLLKQYYQAKTVTLTTTIDPTLLGGFLVTTPVGEIDTTLKYALNQLKLKML